MTVNKNGTAKARKKVARKPANKPALSKRVASKAMDRKVVRKAWKLRPWKSFLLRFIAAVLAIIVFLPMLMLFIYKIDAVHPVSTLMIRDALSGVGARREWVDLQNVSPRVFQSIMMSEDGQFCAHSGVDWNALNEVIDDAMEGERTRGASTITMQLVKNLFLWPDRSILRKGLEVPYAMMAEIVLGKRRIMEIYLNIVELDKGVFGVEAAAQHYFGRSATKLGPKHSSLLAVTLPNPKGRNPAKPSRRLSSLARTIQKRARASGAYIGCLKS